MKEVLCKTILSKVVFILIFIILNSCTNFSIPDYPETWGQRETFNKENFSLNGTYFNYGEVCTDKECLPARAFDIFFYESVSYAGPECEFINFITMRNGNIRISAFNKDNKMFDKAFWFKDDGFEIINGSLVRNKSSDPVWDSNFGGVQGPIGIGAIWAETQNYTLEINLSSDNSLIIHEINSGMVGGIFIAFPVIAPTKRIEKWYRFKKAPNLKQPLPDLYGPGF